MKVLVSVKKQLVQVIIQKKQSNYYDDPDKLVVCVMKDETTSVVIKTFFGLNPAISFFLVDSIKK